MTAPDEPPRRQGLVRWLFEDRTSGRIVIAQWPNLPLWIFIAAFVVQLVLHPAGRIGLIIAVVGGLGLIWWAVDELIRGVNPWRRILGALVLALVAYQWLRALSG